MITALTSIDSYKIGHADQYPPGTTKVYSNFTPRSMKHFNVPNDGRIVWFGLQAFLYELEEIWNETFFYVPWEDISSELDMYIPFCGPKGVNKERFRALWDLGYLPLEIKALAEGTLVAPGIPVLTITNTRPEFYWLPNFLETWMSAELWKAPTSATTARVYRKILECWAEKTGGSREFIAWQAHDFSVRGMSGIADSAKSGAGHLLSFTGTDNLPAVKLLTAYYKGGDTFIGGSVPATEHSVMCAGGKESEVETFRRLLKTYPSGIVSIVSDTWDFWNVITNTARELKEEILARQPDSLGFAKTVFRPDSGDPVKIITGYNVISEVDFKTDNYDPEWAEAVLTDEGTYRVLAAWINYAGGYTEKCATDETISRAEAIGAVECLAEIFGTTTNENGYKTLNPRVGLIYGDSITVQRAEQILERLEAKGYASDNIVFGIGSFTYQYQTRDTLGFAMKATYVEIDGVGQAIFKDPATDDGTKKSAKGLLKVCEDGTLVDNVSWEEEAQGLLKRVYLNGKIISNETLERIRARLA